MSRRLSNFILCAGFFLVVTAYVCPAQSPVGMVEGRVTDRASLPVVNARVDLADLSTMVTRTTSSMSDGFYRFESVPAGDYELRIQSPTFAVYIAKQLHVAVSAVVRMDTVLVLQSIVQEVVVDGGAEKVDLSTNTLGKTIGQRQIVDLPLNGRNFSQLGLLQTGVAQLPSGLLTQGGSLRAGQSYAVNGQRPESNNFLLDGAQNVNRMDGGFALRPPIDALQEFRILTSTAAPEYGGNAGSTTSVVTRSGGEHFHGSLYEFFRNDILDARNYFSAAVEPLKQNQYGLTVGGPALSRKLFFFSYYEGWRNRQGVTQSASVPTAAQQRGDFSGIGYQLINFAAGGVPIPGNQLSPAAFDKVAANVAKLYPTGNTAPSIYTSTLVGRNDYDQTGIRLDDARSNANHSFLRYAFFTGFNLNPVSVRGSDLPGFPTRDDYTVHSAATGNVHSFGPNRTNAMTLSYLHYGFLFDQRLNKTPPSALGFQYQSASAIGQGPPFFNLSGYSPVGGAITGPRTSQQNTFEVLDGFTVAHGRHVAKFGADYIHNGMGIFQSIAPNGFFVFSSSFPTNDAFANLLLGAPVLFYQGLGSFDRGIRHWGSSVFAQDEWRATPRLTLNFGARYEIINPNTEKQDRLNAFVPGVQSTRHPEAPRGLLFPGDAGIGKGIAQSFYAAIQPRVGFAWNPFGDGHTSVRAGYGIFYDPFENGSGVTSQGPVSSLPFAQFAQISGAGLNFDAPYTGRTVPTPNTFTQPATVFAIDKNARPSNAQGWNLSVQQELPRHFVAEMRYVGTKGTHLPRNVEANPAVYGPRATSANADRRRLYANCPASSTAPCDFATIGMLTYGQNSNYHALQTSLSREFEHGLGVNVSYWWSKTMDYLSSMNLQGSSAKQLSGENDLAQNPFNLKAEYGPSLFDARNRLVASLMWQVPFARHTTGVVKTLLDDWQLNGIAVANSASPFTVYDSTNVSLQASSPPISGYAASRPNITGDPTHGPHTVKRWIDPSIFQRLNPQTQAGQFGNARRNMARGPAYANVDLSALKSFHPSEKVAVQFRAEIFNIANHANFGTPVADLASLNFGRILVAGAPRLTQFALKVTY